jgi:hypothetical protein
MKGKANTMKTYILRAAKPVEPQKSGFDVAQPVPATG